MEQPPIHLFGILLQEPITVLTDILVALICFYAYYELKQRGGGKVVDRFFIHYFLLTGIGTFMAGVLGHGFTYVFGNLGKIPGWVFSMIGIYLFERISIIQAGNNQIIKSGTKKILGYFIILKLIIMLPFILYTQDFILVQVFSAIGLLLIVAILNVLIYFKNKALFSKWILLGVFLLIIAASVFGTRLSISPWFNHNDIGHVFMGLSAYCNFRAAKES